MPRKIIVFTAFVLATLPLMLTDNGGVPVIAGTATPNVAGTWEGSWSHRIGSGQITLGKDVREGQMEDSTLIFHVAAPDTPAGQVNFTLTVSGEIMTGTVCGYTCGTVKLKKSKI